MRESEQRPHQSGDCRSHEISAACARDGAVLAGGIKHDGGEQEADGDDSGDVGEGAQNRSSPADQATDVRKAYRRCLVGVATDDETNSHGRDRQHDKCWGEQGDRGALHRFRS